MRYLGAEKLEIIRLVEQSHLPVRRTLAKIGIPTLRTPDILNNLLGRGLRRHGFLHHLQLQLG